MDANELDELLDQLRRFKTDHQTVEAKRAGEALPASTHETLSAFANTEGGTLLFGVDEGAGGFAVTGVADAKQAQADVQALCTQMDPPIRATIELVDHPDGHVVVARIPAVPRRQRPCHRASMSAEDGSFVRVGDGDVRLSADEVRHMLANNAQTDYSAAASAGIRLDAAAVSSLATTLRAASARNATVSDDVLMHRLRVKDDDDTPTLAGALTVGENPQATCAAARVTYRVLPRRTDPKGTRHAGRHAEGTVGELLDELFAWLRADLGQVQAVRTGAVVNIAPIPEVALREALSNALVHRSFAPGLKDRPIVVEVSDEAVVITSPGNVYFSADPALLGLSIASGVRNMTLVRIAAHLTTPSGARVMENQTSGIAAMDQACHAEGVMPALFVDRPDAFQVLLPRGVVDTRSADAQVQGLPTARHGDLVRLLAVAERFGELRDTFPDLAGISFNAALAARALAPCSIEVASGRLAEMEQAGLLRLLTVGRKPIWALPVKVESNAEAAPAAEQHSEGSHTRGQSADRVPDLLAAIEAAGGGVLSASGIGISLGLKSPTSRNRWITRAKDKGLIQPTRDNPFDPHGGYALTPAGRRVLETERSRASPPA